VVLPPSGDGLYGHAWSHVYRLPPLTTLNVGLRDEFKLFNRPCSARLDVANVTNATGLKLSSAYVAVPQLRRNYTFTFAADL
jgi:hypothetical protein